MINWLCHNLLWSDLDNLLKYLNEFFMHNLYTNHISIIQISSFIHKASVMDKLYIISLYFLMYEKNAEI